MAALKPNANAYARVSYARELLGDTKGAIAAMELAVDSSIGATEPSAWSRTLLGNLLLGARRPAEARIRYREALAFVPGYPGALAGLAALRTAGGDLEGAAGLYRRAAAAAPVPEFAASLGDTLAALGRNHEAERAWREAESLERLFVANGGRNLLETAEFDLNHDRNLRSALDRARRGRAERPSVEGDHVLAWALYKNGRCAEARTVSLRSLRLGTLDVDGLYHHSLIEACLGNRAAAADYRGRVARLDPRYLDAPPSVRRLTPTR
jgi:tetratricopeptide (TPR) repeat protein